MYVVQYKESKQDKNKGNRQQRFEDDIKDIIFEDNINIYIRKGSHFLRRTLFCSDDTIYQY